MNRHECLQDENIAEIKKALAEIKEDLQEIKKVWNFLDTGNRVIIWTAKLFISIGAIFGTVYAIKEWVKK